MGNQDWERFGDEIRRSVQEAVDTGDFSKLNQTITDTVDGAANYFSDTVRNVGDRVNQGFRTKQEKNAKGRRNRTGQKHYGPEHFGPEHFGPEHFGPEQSQFGTDPGSPYRTGHNTAKPGGWHGPGQSKANRGSAYGTGRHTSNPYSQNQSTGWEEYQKQRAEREERQRQKARQQAYSYSSVSGGSPGQGGTQKAVPALYASATPAKVGGTLLCVFGCTLSVWNLLVVLFTSIGMVTMGADSNLLALSITFSVLSVGTLAAAAAGIRKLGGVKRFRAYIRELSGREYCNIEELAQRLGKSPKFVLKDVKKMIHKGWFKQGHLDHQEKCLIASNDAYRQYEDLMERAEQQRQEEAGRAVKEKAERQKADREKDEEEENRKRLRPEVREVIEAGEAYIRKIHECNDAIPGEEISAKISRMELLVDRIFDRVEENPESVSDLHRLMDYYLPTTVKLLEAYEDLDAQPVQGENIVSSKQEIEKTLDTLNVAFEKLLDGLFQDTAWDVSSDISVLHTMLAQEGLTDDGLKKGKKHGGE